MESPECASALGRQEEQLLPQASAAASAQQGLPRCLRVPSSPLPYPRPWEVADTKVVFVHVAKASIRRWENHDP